MFLKTSSAMGGLGSRPAWLLIDTALSSHTTDSAPMAFMESSNASPLLPAVHRLALQRLGTELGELDAKAVQVGDVCQSRFRERARSAGLGRHRTMRLEERDGRVDVRRFHPEVIEAGRLLGVGLLQLDKGALADLDVHRRHVALWVAVPERFLESHLLL